MGNYLHKFNNKADFNTAYNGSDYHEPWVSYTTYNQALSFTASISRSGGEFGPYDFTFYEEVDHLSVSTTDVTGTFYIWSYDNGSYIVTTTRNITENTYYEHASWVEGSGCWTTSDNVGGSEYTLVNISSVVNETKGVIDYNKTTWEVLFSGSDIAISGSQTTYSYHNTDGVNYSGEFYDKGTAGFNDYPISSIRNHVNNYEMYYTQNENMISDRVVVRFYADPTISTTDGYGLTTDPLADHQYFAYAELHCGWDNGSWVYDTLDSPNQIVANPNYTGVIPWNWNSGTMKPGTKLSVVCYYVVDGGGG